MERLRDDARHPEPRNFGPEYPCVGADVRVRRAELGEVGVAEGVLRRTVRVAFRERPVVEKDRPRMHAQAPRSCAGDELWEGIRRLAHGGLQAEIAPARRI